MILDIFTSGIFENMTFLMVHCMLIVTESNMSLLRRKYLGRSTKNAFRGGFFLKHGKDFIRDEFQNISAWYLQNTENRR